MFGSDSNDGFNEASSASVAYLAVVVVTPKRTRFHTKNSAFLILNTLDIQS